jgi:hypothetical protein
MSDKEIRIEQTEPLFHAVPNGQYTNAWHLMQRMRELADRWAKEGKICRTLENEKVDSSERLQSCSDALNEALANWAAEVVEKLGVEDVILESPRMCESCTDFAVESPDDHMCYSDPNHCGDGTSCLVYDKEECSCQSSGHMP